MNLSACCLRGEDGIGDVDIRTKGGYQVTWVSLTKALGNKHTWSLQLMMMVQNEALQTLVLPVSAKGHEET